MAFLHGSRLTEIHRGSRPTRSGCHRLKERLDLIRETALIGFDNPEGIPVSLHNLSAEVGMGKERIPA
jgi:hypothetical protein